MINLLSFTLMLSWCSLAVKNPYLMASLFMTILILLTCVISGFSKFMGFVLFLVYVGGIMILISYCVMLTPNNKFKFTLLPFAIPLGLSSPINSYAFGLMSSSNAILMISLLLFLVMLSVIDIVGYSSGAIK